VSRAQRSTTIADANASAFLDGRVAALWWCAAEPGPRFLLRGRSKQPGSRICDAPLRAASRAGHGV